MSIPNCLGQERHLPDHQIKKVHNFMFDLHDQIGSGYSSKVYQGKDCISGYKVAIKVIELKKLTNEIQKVLLNNQIKALNELHHPNLLHALHTMQTINNFYIVSQLYQQNLQSYLKSRGSFTEAETINFLLTMAHALDYLEQNGLIHRDIKPSNIFLSASSEYILGDLGFCQFIRAASCVETGYNIGSPLYMSPEAYKNNIYSHKSDIWSLGICAMELICGKRPFNGVTFDEMVDQVCNKKLYRSLPVSDRLKDVIGLMLAFNCERRASSKQLIEILSSMKSPCQPIQIKSQAQIGQKHRRSLSIRVLNSEKQLNFKNLPRLRASPSALVKNEPSMIVPILTINSHRSIVNRPLSQRCNINSMADLHHQAPNPKIIVLQQLFDLLSGDRNIEFSLNKIKLIRILAILKPKGDLLTKIKDVSFDDPYFNYISQNLVQSHQIFEISHYLVFLLKLVFQECRMMESEQKVYDENLIQTIKCLNRSISLWTNSAKQKENSNVSKVQMS